ncbi:MAG: TPM domain-containing protein, partial [Flavobacteriales bacterium]|nr:TPM domain-containing protein [Flavobacteriales bacterium]
ELRVHLEDHIEEDVLDHAAYVFEELGMHRTRDRNGVLVYVAVADRQVAVLGDSGINEQVPDGFWTDVVGLLKLHFAAGRHAEGLVEAVHLIGEKLSSFFPLREDDTDELSNEVSIGRR